MPVEPHADSELAYARDYARAHRDTRTVAVIGLDEVGRGAIAGPVMVGAFAYVMALGSDGEPRSMDVPAGIRDSKLLGAARRQRLYSQLVSGYVGAVGGREASQIDERGIMCSLGEAAADAYREVRGILDSSGIAVARIMLDGNVDYLSAHLSPGHPAVQVQVRGDLTCVSIAAASILAKVHRDDVMTRMAGEYPQYQWEKNKGYGSAAHRLALEEHGLSPLHRSSWNLLPR